MCSLSFVPFGQDQGANPPDLHSVFSAQERKYAEMFGAYRFELRVCSVCSVFEFVRAKLALKVDWGPSSFALTKGRLSNAFVSSIHVPS